MKMPDGIRIAFKMYMTSANADQSCTVTSTAFAELSPKLIRSYLKENAKVWKTLLDTEFAVNDFRLMTKDETKSYVMGTHKHKIGADNEDTNIRH